MTTGVSGTTQGAAADTAATQTTTKNEKPSEKEMFLQLLVAQIKNQNPLNPADGMQFVTQLAQFSELEQITQIRTEVEALHADLTGTASAPDSETDKTQEN